MAGIYACAGPASGLLGCLVCRTPPTPQSTRTPQLGLCDAEMPLFAGPEAGLSGGFLVCYLLHAHRFGLTSQQLRGSVTSRSGGGCNTKAAPGAATWACAVPAFCLPPGGRFANTPRDRAGLFANRSDLSGSPGSRERKPPPSYPAVLPICTSPIPRRNAHLAACGPGRPGTGRFCM